jgi:hypothetical protein
MLSRASGAITDRVVSWQLMHHGFAFPAKTSHLGLYQKLNTMNPNRSYCYGLMLLATLWLGCGIKMSPEAVLEHTKNIVKLEAENAELLGSNVVGELRLRGHVATLTGDSADDYGWIELCVSTISKDRVTLLTSIQDCKSKLERFAGKDAQLSTYNEPDELSSTHQEMMGNDQANGGRGDGTALRLRQGAREFQAVVADWVHTSQLKLEIPAIAADALGSHWEADHFGDKPALLAIVELELLKRDILKMESVLVQGLLQELHLGEATQQTETKQGKLALRCTPVSKVVPSGMKAEGNLSIDNLPVGATVEFEGGGVTMEGDGATTATLRATSPDGFAKGSSEKPLTQTASAKVTLPDGLIQELETQCRFTIRKPVAVITPSPDKPLRRGQKNQLMIDVPDLGEYYSPQVEATDATLQPNASDKRKFTITPTGSTTTLTIRSLTNGQRILVDKVTFQVK